MLNCIAFSAKYFRIIVTWRLSRIWLYKPRRYTSYCMFDCLAPISGIFQAQGACTSIPGVHFIYTSQRTCHNKQFWEGGEYLWVISWWLYSTGNYVCSQCIYEVLVTIWWLTVDVDDGRHLFSSADFTYWKNILILQRRWEDWETSSWAKLPFCSFGPYTEARKSSWSCWIGPKWTSTVTIKPIAFVTL